LLALRTERRRVDAEHESANSKFVTDQKLEVMCKKADLTKRNPRLKAELQDTRDGV